MEIDQKTASLAQRVFLIIGVVGVFTACSRKKDKWVNRNFHGMATYYNILYNGTNALEDGKEQINAEYVENYWEILPIERIQTDEEPIVYGRMLEAEPPKEPTSRIPDQPASQPAPEPEEDAQKSGEFKYIDTVEPTDQNKPAFPIDKDPTEELPIKEQNKETGQPNQETESAFEEPNQPDDVPLQENNTPVNQGEPQEDIQRNNKRESREDLNRANPTPETNTQNTTNPTGEQNQQSPENVTPERNDPVNTNTQQQTPDQNTNLSSEQQVATDQNTVQQNTDGTQTKQPGSIGIPDGTEISGGFSASSTDQQNTTMPAQGAPVEQAISGLDSDQTEQFSIDENFERAEEKATKAIQKHSMDINGKERNPQMGEAFLLLGKARYYDGRYFPALEAFNYLSRRYDNQDLLNTVAVWREKTYLQLENNERVVEKLNGILNGYPELNIHLSQIPNALNQTYITKDPDFDFVHNLFTIHELVKETAKKAKSRLNKESLTEASSTLAQAYLNLEEHKQALKPLNLAINTTKDKPQKGRFLFIKGQTFEQLQKQDSAKASFDEVIALNRRAPRDYVIQAYMGKIRHFDLENGSREEQIDTLESLLTDRENRPYLDVINYYAADYYQKTDSVNRALTHYNKSLNTGTENHELKARIYEALGNHYFDRSNYKMAGAYYDSTMVNQPEVSRAFRATRKKRLNLNDVIKYEDIATKNDSILQLVSMNPQERQEHLTKYVDSIKNKAIAQIQKNEQEEETTHLFTQQTSQAGGSNFYFYDDSRVATGKETFKQIWGDRELQDNWRTETGSSLKEEQEEAQAPERKLVEDLDQNPKYQVQTYINQLPTNEKVIDSLTDERNYAYYQLGLLYSTQFEELELAADKLEELLENKPEERLVLPSKYNLFKIYSELKDSTNANKWKEDIITHHQDSRYAQLLENPAEVTDQENNPEKIYNTLYKSYQQGNYQEVLELSDQYISRFNDEEILPKIELLQANVKGRLLGFEAYTKALNNIALTYPQSKEGKKAEELISKTLPQLKNKTFSEESKGSFYLIFPFSLDQTTDAEAFKTNLDQHLSKHQYKQLKTSTEIYTEDTLFVVVKGLNGKSEAKKLNKALEEHKNFEIHPESFGISSENFKIILIHKNLSAYLKQFNY